MPIKYCKTPRYLRRLIQIKTTSLTTLMMMTMEMEFWMFSTISVLLATTVTSSQTPLSCATCTLTLMVMMFQSKIRFTWTVNRVPMFDNWWQILSTIQLELTNQNMMITCSQCATNSTLQRLNPAGRIIYNLRIQPSYRTRFNVPSILDCMRPGTVTVERVFRLHGH